MAFKIKDGIKIGLVDVFNNTGELLVNAPTATKLLTPRSISIAGAASGSATFDGSADITIELSIDGLDFEGGAGGTPTLTGDLTGNVLADNGSTIVLENGTNGSDASFRGNLLASNGTVVLTVGDGVAIPEFEGNANSADTADKWDNARTVSFATGDISGSFSIDGSADVENVNLTINANSVENSMLVNSSITIGTGTVSLGSVITDINGLTSFSTDDISIDGNIISSKTTNTDVRIEPNGTGTIIVPEGYESRAGFTSNSLVNKAYVDAVAEGLTLKPAVRGATVSNLDSTYDNGVDGVGSTLTSTSNGAFPTIDDVGDWQLFDGILVKDQTNAFENGRYYVSQIGDETTPWILTRCPKCDELTEIPSMFIFVQEGTTYNSTGWVATVDTLPMTVGVDDIIFQQFSGAGTYTAGDGLDLTGTVFSVNVDNSTIEIVSDTLRVKDAGITNAKLENAFITIIDTLEATDAISLGETFSIVGTSGISTSIAENVLTISNEDSGSSQDIVKTFTVTDTAGAGTYLETGSYSVSGNSDELTFESGSGINLDIDVDNGIIRVANTQPTFKTIQVSGNADIVADSTSDTLTFVAGDNISIVTDGETDSITINALSSTQGDDAFDNLEFTVATTAPTVIDSFAITEFRSGKYYIQISQGSNFQVSELMVIHDGTTTYDTEFAVLENISEVGAFTTAINGSNVDLIVTMNTSTSAVIRMKRLLIEI